MKKLKESLAFESLTLLGGMTGGTRVSSPVRFSSMSKCVWSAQNDMGANAVETPQASSGTTGHQAKIPKNHITP